MIPRLSKGIAELEGSEQRFVWQAPDIYDQIMSNSIWLIYGRKGSGKSTLIEYLGKNNPNYEVEIFRPGDTTLFSEVSRIITSLKNEDKRVIEEAVSCAIDFVLISTMMRKRISLTGVLPPGSNKEKIYNFLVNQDLFEGSIASRAIKFITKALNAVKKGEYQGVLQAVQGDISFSSAKNAFLEELRNIGRTIVLCIDDIDEIGFSFSRYDRHFVNGLLMFMVKANKLSVQKQVDFRTIVTMPSELYFHSTLWGGDWITGKSESLAWENVDDLQALVNKRLAYEMNIKKKKAGPLVSDTFSISTEHTWNRVFPVYIKNKLDITEATFEYLIRHTFYTPRHILDLCDVVLSQFHEFENLDVVKETVSQNEWNRIIQSCVEDFCSARENDYRKLFSLIYEGLDDVLNLFCSRPVIWNQYQLTQFISNSGLKLKRKDTEKEFSGEAIIDILQQTGFLGLGQHSIKRAPQNNNRYEWHFSFLDKQPYRGGWQIAAIAPMFYDVYDIRPVRNVRITPHKSLLLPHRIENYLASYNIESNQFTRYANT